MDIFIAIQMQLSTVGNFTLSITDDYVLMVDSNMNTVYYRNCHRSFEYTLGTGESMGNHIIMNQVDS